MVRRFLVVLVLLSLHAEVSAQAPVRKIRVLFIGNSYTYFNNLPEMLAQLAASTPHPKQVQAEMVVEGGATLRKLWDQGNARQAIRQGHWDFVVLQEQSTLGEAGVVDGIVQIHDPTAFHEAARLFDAEIKQAGARTVFFLTWARQNSPESQAKLNSAYESIARELGGQLAPVGPAWQNAFKKDPKLRLHQSDKSHPTPAGSYLAACVFYAVLFGESPTGAASVLYGRPVDDEGRPNDSRAKLVNLPTAETRLLQDVAWQTVQEFKIAARIKAGPAALRFSWCAYRKLADRYCSLTWGGLVNSRRRRVWGGLVDVPAVASCVAFVFPVLAASSEDLYLGSLTYP